MITKQDIIEDFRANGDLQAHGALHPMKGKFCAIGRVLDRIDSTRWRPDEYSDEYAWINDEGKGFWHGIPFDDIEAHAELGRAEIDAIAVLNDRGYTFAELANLIEFGDVIAEIDKNDYRNI